MPQVSYRNVSGRYFLRMQEAEEASWARLLANMVTTDQESEVHKWLSSVNAPAKWTGERRKQDFTDYGLTIVGEKYESGFSIQIDDKRRNKIKEQLDLKPAELAGKVATVPQRLLSDLINNGGSRNAFDGLSFFNTTRTIRKSGTINNDITVSGLGTPDAPTTAGMSQAILSGIQAMLAFKDDAGDPINEFARVFYVMVPVRYMMAAEAAVTLPFSSAGVSNLIPAMGKMQIIPITNPRLTDTNNAAGRRIAIFRGDASIKSMIVQDEDIGSEAFKMLGEDSDNAFWKDEIVFGAKRITNVAPGLPQLAMRVNLAA